MIEPLRVGLANWASPERLTDALCELGGWRRQGAVDQRGGGALRNHQLDA